MGRKIQIVQTRGGGRVLRVRPKIRTSPMLQETAYDDTDDDRLDEEVSDLEVGFGFGDIGKALNVVKHARKLVSAAASGAGVARGALGGIVAGARQLQPTALADLAVAAASAAPSALGKKGLLGLASKAINSVPTNPKALMLLAANPALIGTKFGAGLAAKAFGIKSLPEPQDLLKGLSPLADQASKVTAFIPGLGSAVTPALATAAAIGAGKSLEDTALAAARGLVPGGPAALAAFDAAIGLVSGQKASDAAIAAARDQLPGGPFVQAAFDAGLRAAGIGG